VESITEVTALAIPVTEFNSLLESDIRFNHLLIHTFVTRIVHTSERAAFQQVNTTERSLTRLKQLFKDADLQLSKEDMAAYLGITVRSLNRTLKALNK
jgi:CRP-like cAMP-binding protein